MIHGTASLKNANTIRVQQDSGDGIDLETNVILIATGSSPFHPDNIPFDHKLIYDSDSILRMDRIPRTMSVIGGGVIGCEYASIFTALGVKVTLIESRARLLPYVDGEIASRLQSGLEQLGLRFIFNDRVAVVEIGRAHV